MQKKKWQRSPWCVKRDLLFTVAKPGGICGVNLHIHVMIARKSSAHPLCIETALGFNWWMNKAGGEILKREQKFIATVWTLIEISFRPSLLCLATWILSIVIAILSVQFTHHHLCTYRSIHLWQSITISQFIHWQPRSICANYDLTPSRWSAIATSDGNRIRALVA